MVKRGIKRDIEKFKLILNENNISWDRILLFGSSARGLNSKGSDIDICVILKKDEKNISSIASRLNGLAGLNDLNMDIIVTTMKKYQTNMVSPILHQIRKFGIEI